MRARRTGYVEAAGRLLQFRNIDIKSKVEKYAVYLPGKRPVILRNPNLAPVLNTSPLERYFLRPTQFNDMDFLTICKGSHRNLFPKTKLTQSTGQLKELQPKLWLRE